MDVKSMSKENQPTIEQIQRWIKSLFPIVSFSKFDFDFLKIRISIEIRIHSLELSKL